MLGRDMLLISLPADLLISLPAESKEIKTSCLN